MSNKYSNTDIYDHLIHKYGQNGLSFSLPELKASLATTGIDIPERTLRRWLVQWVESNQLTRSGQKRGTRYDYNSTPQALSQTFLTNIEASKRPALLAKLRDLWTHNSTALEGNTLTLGDTNAILELGLTISGKPLREHHEIIGHAKAIELIYEISTQQLNKENLFALHKAVQTEVVVDIYQPVGKWKVEKNYTNSVTSKGKQVIIEYADPKHIDGLMSQLIETINHWEIDTITADNAHLNYAKIHLAFVHTHPFADGNGRLARLIANLPLLRAGLPPLLIDQNNRREYITLLADYQSETPAPKLNKNSEQGFWPQPELIEPFSEFCAKNYLTTFELLD